MRQCVLTRTCVLPVVSLRIAVAVRAAPFVCRNSSAAVPVAAKPGCSVPSLDWIGLFWATLITVTATLAAFLAVAALRWKVTEMMQARRRGMPSDTAGRPAQVQSSDSDSDPAKAAAEPEPVSARVDFERRRVHVSIIAGLLFYLKVVTLQVSAFQCFRSPFDIDLFSGSDGGGEPAEADFLQADARTQCYRGNHAWTMAFVLVSIIGFTIGLPVALTIRLRRAFSGHKDQPTQPDQDQQDEQQDQRPESQPSAPPSLLFTKRPPLLDVVDNSGGGGEGQQQQRQEERVHVRVTSSVVAGGEKDEGAAKLAGAASPSSPSAVVKTADANGRPWSPAGSAGRYFAEVAKPTGAAPSAASAAASLHQLRMDTFGVMFDGLRSECYLFKVNQFVVTVWFALATALLHGDVPLQLFVLGLSAAYQSLIAVAFMPFVKPRQNLTLLAASIGTFGYNILLLLVQPRSSDTPSGLRATSVTLIVLFALCIVALIVRSSRQQTRVIWVTRPAAEGGATAAAIEMGELAATPRVRPPPAVVTPLRLPAPSSPRAVLVHNPEREGGEDAVGALKHSRLQQSQSQSQSPAQPQPPLSPSGQRGATGSDGGRGGLASPSRRSGSVGGHAWVDGAGSSGGASVAVAGGPVAGAAAVAVGLRTRLPAIAAESRPSPRAPSDSAQAEQSEGRPAGDEWTPVRESPRGAAPQHDPEPAAAAAAVAPPAAPVLVAPPAAGIEADQLPGTIEPSA